MIKIVIVNRHDEQNCNEFELWIKFSGSLNFWLVRIGIRIISVLLATITFIQVTSSELAHTKSSIKSKLSGSLPKTMNWSHFYGQHGKDNVFVTVFHAKNLFSILNTKPTICIPQHSQVCAGKARANVSRRVCRLLHFS